MWLPGARRATWRRWLNETKRLATDEPATRLVSERGVLGVFNKTFYQKVSQGQGNPPFYRSGGGRRRPSAAGDCRRFVTRGEANGGPGGRHLHTGPVTVADWPKPGLRGQSLWRPAASAKRLWG